MEYRPKSLSERTREVEAAYPRPDFSSGYRIALPFPAYTRRDRQVRSDAWQKGLTVEGGRRMVVDNDSEYDDLVKVLAATPTREDVLSVFYAMCRRDGDAEGDEVLRLSDESDVPPEVVEYVLWDMREHMLLYETGEEKVTHCRVNASLLRAAKPTPEEARAIQDALAKLGGRGAMVMLDDLSIACGLSVGRLVEINNFVLCLEYLRHRADYAGDYIPSEAP